MKDQIEAISISIIDCKKAISRGGLADDVVSDYERQISGLEAARETIRKVAQLGAVLRALNIVS